MLGCKTADDQNACLQYGGGPKCSSAKRRRTKMLVCKRRTTKMLVCKRQTTKILVHNTADDQNARLKNGGRPKCSSAKRQMTKMLVRKTADDQNARLQNGRRPKCSSAKRQTTKMLVRKYPFFWYESSSWIKLRLHTKTQLPRYL